MVANKVISSLFLRLPPHTPLETTITAAGGGSGRGVAAVRSRDMFVLVAHP